MPEQSREAPEVFELIRSAGTHHLLAKGLFTLPDNGTRLVRLSDHIALTAEYEAQVKQLETERDKAREDNAYNAQLFREQRDRAERFEEQLGEARQALKPLAALADEADALRHPDNSTCEWRLKATDLRRARAILNSNQPVPEQRDCGEVGERLRERLLSDEVVKLADDAALKEIETAIDEGRISASTRAALEAAVQAVFSTQQPQVVEAGGCEEDYERVARAFHGIYETIAPEFGYETRPESRVAWQDVPEKNRALMVGTVRRLAETGVISIGTGENQPRLGSVELKAIADEIAACGRGVVEESNEFAYVPVRLLKRLDTALTQPVDDQPLIRRTSEVVHAAADAVAQAKGEGCSEWATACGVLTAAERAAASKDDQRAFSRDETLTGAELVQAAKEELAERDDQPRCGGSGEVDLKALRDDVEIGVRELLEQAGLQSAPETFWGGAKRREEQAWLKGRDDTLEHVRGDLEHYVGKVFSDLEEAQPDCKKDQPQSEAPETVWIIQVRNLLEPKALLCLDARQARGWEETGATVTPYIPATQQSEVQGNYCDQCEKPKAEVASLQEGETLCASCLLVRVSTLFKEAEGHDYKLTDADHCPFCGKDIADKEVQGNSGGVEECPATVPASEYDALADSFRDFVAGATMTPASEVGVVELGEHLRDLADDEYAFLAQALKQGSHALASRQPSSPPTPEGSDVELLESLVKSIQERERRSAQAGDMDGESYHQGRADGVRAAIKELQK